MKTIFYKIFALLFNLCRIFKIKSGRVALLSSHNADFNDSLGAIATELEKRQGLSIIYINTMDLKVNTTNGFVKIFKSIFRAVRFFTVNAYYLATSQYVFLNDNFMPMANLNFSKKTVITQLWHAQGVFKKFGLSITQPDKIRKRELYGNKKLSYVVCSSKGVAPYYSEAFGVSIEQILPLGSPRTDYFFKHRDVGKMRALFDEDHPECVGKKLILYAPTFRDSPEDDKKLLDNFDFEWFNSELSEEYALLLRLHPQIRSSRKNNVSATDVSDYRNVNDLILLCDLLITDYSSICMDFALLNKPTCFFAFDLDDYSAQRQFYFDYESYVPGPVAKTFDELINTLKANNFHSERAEEFKKFNFDTPDGNAAKRVVEKTICDN
ncbi:MAG TPA: CDP-glycerol glycerophosphotransferase family protein [Clostridia bacterium]|nr:CDP-glycerol glycerophosphotransferase family protein [Clostridia bacterium]